MTPKPPEVDAEIVSATLWRMGESLKWNRPIPTSDVQILLKHVADLALRSVDPVPMLLWCPECGARDVDVGEFATKRHHTHSCQLCGMTWRPAIVATVGVKFLPGFKDEVTALEPTGPIDPETGLPMQSGDDLRRLMREDGLTFRQAATELRQEARVCVTCGVPIGRDGVVIVKKTRALGPTGSWCPTESYCATCAPESR